MANLFGDRAVMAYVTSAGKDGRCRRLCWKIEVSYYEQKTFWSLCRYMLRSAQGIGMLVNTINLAYSAMKLLPYTDADFAEYQGQSVQDFRFALSEAIRE